MVLGLGSTVEHPLLRIRVLEARDLAPLTQAAVHAPLGSTNASHVAPTMQRDGYAAANPLGQVPLAGAAGVTPATFPTTHNANAVAGISGSEVAAERLAAPTTLASGVLADGAIRQMPDPYVKISMKGLLKKKFNTATLQNTVHPVFNEEFVFEPKHAEKDVLVVKVFDAAVKSTLPIGAKNLLGVVRIPVFEYLNRGIIDEWRPLLTKTGSPARGDVRIQIAYGTNFPAPLLRDDKTLAAAPTMGVATTGVAPHTATVLVMGEGLSSWSAMPPCDLSDVPGVIGVIDRDEGSNGTIDNEVRSSVYLPEKGDSVRVQIAGRARSCLSSFDIQFVLQSTDHPNGRLSHFTFCPDIPQRKQGTEQLLVFLRFTERISRDLTEHITCLDNIMAEPVIVALEESLSNGGSRIQIENSSATLESDSTFPKQVPLCPIYTRPIFPNSTIRSTTNGSSRVISALPMGKGKIQQVIDRIKEVGGKDSGESIKLDHNVEEDVEVVEDQNKNAISHGATVIIEKGYIEALGRLKKNGETHVALSLIKPRDNLSTTSVDSVYAVGVLARIESVNECKFKDGSRGLQIELRGTHRIAITGIVKSSESADPLGAVKMRRVTVRELKEPRYNEASQMCRALTMAIESRLQQLSRLNHPLFQPQLLVQYNLSCKTASQLADFVASLVFGSPEQLQKILSQLDVIERMKSVLLLLQMETDLSRILFEKNADGGNGAALGNARNRISMGTDKKNGKFIEKLKEKMDSLTLPVHAKEVIEEEMNKLKSLDPTFNATEHSLCRNYLTSLLDVPWGKCSEDNIDLDAAKKILDEDHYGLDDIKDRILEFLAVASLKGTLTGKILCFIGPPGVGKTSIGRSISRTIGRQFYRMSVGGMNDVAEIKGHRRTYIGAMPGKVVQALKQTKTMNPVLLIDEVDKISKNWNGDPAAALLEVLDPEQNGNFLDHYLDIPVDLSKVLFVCTANGREGIPRPLLDRMEIIELSGYYSEEKINIATRHLIPKLRENTNLPEDKLKIEEGALRKIIVSYSREAGVRSLNKNLEKAFRKVALKIMKNKASTIVINESNVEEFLGKPIFLKDRLYDIMDPPPGVVAGLAYNQIGGSMIWIESVITGSTEPSHGNADKEKSQNLQMSRYRTTGKLGDVMKESAEISYTYAKTLCHSVQKNNTFFERTNIHTHFPEGAIPKDGPSAGCAIVTSLLSLMFDRSIDSSIAMTGEITLTGKVLPVGGIKEKIMAAKRCGIKRVFLPEPNKRDFEELPEGLKGGIAVEYVDHYTSIYKSLFSERQSALGAAFMSHSRYFTGTRVS
ncbi:mitochondrial lon peptidase 1-like [Planoprotostelium fungivorum]|uniref:Lon protease homolog n=1 Tax=Planoprotostelium fungivorum TaxID=1890364 RepID=A0A2P6NS22_9EUKA|nr:mitochondrial lon peptidase 1-like [Planoprotostelium fungivorum]